MKLMEINIKGEIKLGKKVFIDAGHGGNDSGAVGVNNLYEKTINLSVSQKIVELLKKQGLEVKISRNIDSTMSLQERTDMANNWKADCFVSIHCNAYNGSAKGVETYGYSSNTIDLASNIQEAILKTDAYTLNRGVKTAGFYVLKNTTMRAALIELAFIDNKDDVKILIEKQDILAEAVAKGICKYLSVEYKSQIDDKKSDTIEVVDSNIFYRVVCGSYNNRLYAEEQLEELQSLGIKDAFITIYKKE